MVGDIWLVTPGVGRGGPPSEGSIQVSGALFRDIMSKFFLGGSNMI